MESQDDQQKWLVTDCSKFHVSLVKLKTIVTRHERDLKYLYENDIKKMDKERDHLYNLVKTLSEKIKVLEDDKIKNNKEKAQDLLLTKNVQNYERNEKNTNKSIDQQNQMDNLINRVQDKPKVSYAEVTSNKTYFISENLENEHSETDQMNNNSLDKE